MFAHHDQGTYRPAARGLTTGHSRAVARVIADRSNDNKTATVDGKRRQEGI
jgi:hypothetical protein